MKYVIVIGDISITVVVQNNSRAKRLNLKFVGNETIQVTKPRFLPLHFAQKFVADNYGWIYKQILLQKKQKAFPSFTQAQITEYKIKTRNLVRSCLSKFNLYYNFKFNRITIRDQKTRWGSCSSNGTLSFNFRLCLLPQELSEYVVVHELCHLKEMNHSQQFWGLVAKTLPDYKKTRKRLKQFSL